MSSDPLAHTLAGERDVLTSFLASVQNALARKASGLSDTDARRTMTPSGLSISGLIKHGAYVQASWVEYFFAGRLATELPLDTDEFVAAPDETIEVLLDRYRGEVARVRMIVERHSLDELNQSDRPGTVTLRWIVVHMIEELARHTGHADILREEIDGATGYP